MACTQKDVLHGLEASMDEAKMLRRSLWVAPSAVALWARCTTTRTRKILDTLVDKGKVVTDGRRYRLRVY